MFLIQEIYNMNKKETRKKYIEIRKNIDEKKREEESGVIVEKIRKIIDENSFDSILLYAPLDHEVDVFSLFDEVYAEDAQCDPNFCFPRVNGDEMDFFYVKDASELETGNFGVREPNESCRLFIPEKNRKYLIIVPGVCFDESGYRIGYGKGYYDKYLSKYKDMNFTKAGICFKECFLKEIEHDEFDIPTDMVITSDN